MNVFSILQWFRQFFTIEKEVEWSIEDVDWAAAEERAWQKIVSQLDDYNNESKIKIRRNQLEMTYTFSDN